MRNEHESWPARTCWVFLLAATTLDVCCSVSRAHTLKHTHTYTPFVVVWVLSIVRCCCCFYTLLPTFLYVAKLQNVQRLRLRLRRRRHRRVRWLWLWRIKYIEKQLAAILTWPPFPRSSADPAKGACLPDALLSLVFLHWVRASNFKWETFQPVKSKTGIETGHTRTRGDQQLPAVYPRRRARSNI